MGNATTVADFALYDALKWHHALDGHLVSKYGNIVEYIGKHKAPKKGVPKSGSIYKKKGQKNCEIEFHEIFPHYICDKRRQKKTHEIQE